MGFSLAGAVRGESSAGELHGAGSLFSRVMGRESIIARGKAFLVKLSGFFPHIFIPCVAVSSMMLGGVSEPGCVFWLGLQKCILICFFQRLSLFHFFHS